ncbi:MAG TPA: hypothetical protein VG405_00705 [Solirubrobacteraceae bacterium]|nr:hypothetical protein [Solirubrobacteraceae bacterium]
MAVLRIVVGLLAAAGVAAVLASVIRTVVLPRGVPARLARLVFLAVRQVLTLRLRIGRDHDYRTRDRVFALQAPLGLFAQLFAWGVLILLCFSAIFWALATHANLAEVPRAVELAGSSLFTLGFDTPDGLIRQVLAFAAAGVGLTLFALVITYLPSVYGAFSRREALVTKLVVRTGAPPDGPRLLIRSWELARFEQLDLLWNDWEDWFIDVGESHTSFPQLSFFRSPHPNNHWILTAEAVLDGAALLITVCDVEREYRSELCLDAGASALITIADFLGIPHQPPEPEAEIALPEPVFQAGCDRLAEAGVPLVEDRQQAWRDFRRLRSRYEPLVAVLGRMTDAPRSEWSSWSDDAPRHSPPLLRIHRPRQVDGGLGQRDP